MGMQVPVENTPAIMKLHILEKQQPKRHNCEGVPPQFLDPVDFKTRLEAATDKIKAYKAYFYDKG
jgi:hypothetical protein